MRKIIITILIVFLMPMMAGAQEPYAVLSDDNSVLTFFYDNQKAERNGMDVGPFEYIWNGQTYEGIFADWHKYWESITSVVFDDSFSGCTTLTSTAYWFWNLSNLSSIAGINNLKTDNVTDMSYMFAGCSGLRNIDLTGFKTDNVTDMSGMFVCCYGLTSIDLTGFKTNNVKSMRNLFESCASLTSLDLTGIKTDNVTDMSEMFYGCFNLTKIDMTGFNTENVTTMYHMFYGCSILTSLDMTRFKTDNVTDMSGIFEECRSLTSIDLTGFNTRNVKYMGGMFEGCSSLTSIDLTGFNTENVTSMSGMFARCSSLTRLDLTEFKTDNVTSMQGMFSGCSGLTTIFVGKGWSTANIESSYWGLDVFNGCKKLVGGAGTKYNENRTDYTYAHIDGGSDNPGYFTAAGSETGIDTIHSLHSPAHSYYTLDGRKLQNEPTNKGVYVVDGRKVIIK